MKVLMAIDGSEYSRAAIDLMVRIPFQPGTEVCLVSVIEWFTPTFLGGHPIIGHQVREALDKVETSLRQEFTAVLQAAFQRLRSKGFYVRTQLRHGHVAGEILEAAETCGADLVVIGSRGLGRFQGLMLGSVTDQVVNHAPCSVLVVKRPEHGNVTPLGNRQGPENERDYQDLRVLLAFDNSRNSQGAVETLKSLPPDSPLSISVLTVVPDFSRYGLDSSAVHLLTDVRKAEMEAAQVAVRGTGHQLQPTARQVIAEVREGDPRCQIVRAAQEQAADIVVLGARGKSALERLLLGTVAGYVVQHAPCAVWLVR